jgi:hypothetical protein
VREVGRSFFVDAEALTIWLVALPLAEQAQALMKTGFKLTLCARSYSSDLSAPADSRSLVTALLGINELQHKILSQAGLYLKGEQKKIYPVDVFCRIVFEIANQHGISSALTRSLEHVREPN